MDSTPQKTAILITGASGFVGSHLVEFLKENCIIYALSRRSQRDSGVAAHSNIHLIRCDIGKRDKLAQVTVEKRHYRLVASDQIDASDLKFYAQRT